MSLKYLDDILELLSSENFKTLVKDVEFNLQGTIKVNVIEALFTFTILFYIWQKLFREFHREVLNPEFIHTNEQNSYPPEEPTASSENESMDFESADIEGENFPGDLDAIPDDQESWSEPPPDDPRQHIDDETTSLTEHETSDIETGNFHEVSEATQDDPEGWSGPIIRCNCGSH
jgi:hypothetical protein